MQASEADFYRTRELRKREAMAARRAAGEAMHLAPLGFRNARDAEGRSVIEPDPETYPLVREALAMRERGESVRAICRVMRERGLRSKRGKPVGPSGLHRLLSARLDGGLPGALTEDYGSGIGGTRTNDFYREISARGKKGCERLRGEGRFTGRAPLGYRNARDRLGYACLEVDEPAATVIREMYRMRAEGMPVREIRRAAAELGLRARSGKPLSLAGVQWVLNCLTYRGLVRTPEGELVRGTHDAIVFG